MTETTSVPYANNNAGPGDQNDPAGGLKFALLTAASSVAATAPMSSNASAADWPTTMIAVRLQTEPQRPTSGVTTTKIAAAAVSLDLGEVPVRIEPQAADFLAKLPIDDISILLRALRDWIDSQNTVRLVRIGLFRDPEANWEEAIFTIVVDGDQTQTLALWQGFLAHIDGVDLDQPSLRYQLRTNIGVHFESAGERDADA